jgi:hypothetical protein
VALHLFCVYLRLSPQLDIIILPRLSNALYCVPVRLILLYPPPAMFQLLANNLYRQKVCEIICQGKFGQQATYCFKLEKRCSNILSFKKSSNLPKRDFNRFNLFFRENVPLKARFSNLTRFPIQILEATKTDISVTFCRAEIVQENI